MRIEMTTLKTVAMCIAGALLLADLAAASEEAIEKCREAATADEQIACLEAALRGSDAASGEVAATGSAATETEAAVADIPGEEAPAARPEEPGPETANAEPEPAATAATQSAEPDPAAPPPNAEPAAAAAVAATSRNSEPASTYQAAPEGIGAEQVVARNMTREEQLASLESATGLKVARYGEVPYQRLVVHLENGQVWRQIVGDDQYFRVDLRRNQTVDINETSMGGYKLRLNEMRRTIRVERVE